MSWFRAGGVVPLCYRCGGYKSISSVSASTSTCTTSSSKSINSPVPSWLLRFDGGRRGSSGQAGAGSVIYSMNINGSIEQEVWYGYTYLGPGITSNQAEYAGLLGALKQAVKMQLEEVTIQGDSNLVIQQLQKKFKVRSPNLTAQYAEAVQLLENIKSIEFEHIPRTGNQRADQLANIAMDTKSSFSSS